MTFLYLSAIITLRIVSKFMQCMIVYVHNMLYARVCTNYSDCSYTNRESSIFMPSEKNNA